MKYDLFSSLFKASYQAGSSPFNVSLNDGATALDVDALEDIPRFCCNFNKAAFLFASIRCRISGEIVEGVEVTEIVEVAEVVVIEPIEIDHREK